MERRIKTLGDINIQHEATTAFLGKSSLGQMEPGRRSLMVTRTGEAEAVSKDSTLEMFSYIDINVKKKNGELAAGAWGVRFFCKMREHTMSVCQSS